MAEKENTSKYNAQIKYRKNNLKQFNIDFKPEIFDNFVIACKKNSSTPTTEIKKFVNYYIKNNL